MLDKIISSIKAIAARVSYAKTISAVMRLPRPVAFFLIVALFVTGWHSPATLLAFAQAISALPEPFWTICYGLLGSIALTKLLRDKAGN